MARTTEQLLDRVRKLLALASSDNVHEAALAAGQAQQLITRHRLAALLDAEEEAVEALSDGRDQPLEVARKIRKWKSVLAQGLASANGCQAYTVSVSRREQHLCVAGRAEDQEAVAALWEWLVKRLEWLSATHGPGEDRDWHESFRIGAADAIAARLVSVQDEERVAMEATALVAVDLALAARSEAVERFSTERLRLKRGRSIRVDPKAMDAGRRAGASVPLPGSTDP